MKITGTPVFRPTKECIWNSFQSSGKRHLLLTGGRGSGKTSLLSGLAESLSLSGLAESLPYSELAGDHPPSGALPGVTTWAEQGKAVYLRENGSGRTVQVGRFDPALAGKENKMRPLKEGFEVHGVSMLRRCMEKRSPWVSVDEIGYLEAGCTAYCGALRELLERKRVLAAVRKQDLPFLKELLSREDAFVVDLDKPYGRLGCVIMASGLGRRFGGNKLLAKFQGKPLIERAFSATEGIFEKRVVVTRHQEIEELCHREGIPVVLHDLPYRSDTIRLGLAALTGEEELTGCMFCPGDQPLLSWETTASLALCAASAKPYIWRAAWEGREGAPVLFPRECLEELRTLPEGKSGGYVVKNHRELVRLVSVRDPWELADADSPAELERLSEIFRENC